MASNTIKGTFFSLFLAVSSCGPHGGKENSGPCEIELRYTETRPNNLRDLVRYDSFKSSESCQYYKGENVRTLTYKLKTKSKPSVGTLGHFFMSGRTANLEQFSLAEGGLEIPNLAQDDWTGPLDSFNGIYMIYVFPQNTERALYPTEVKLVISR